MRFVAILLLILAVMFGGHAIYYRGKTDSLLTKTLNQLPDNPKSAYHQFKTIMKYNNFLTMGKVDGAHTAFLDRLERTIIRELKLFPPPASSFQQAREASDVLATYRSATGKDIRPIRDGIVQAAKDAMPVVRDGGTLSAWHAMIAFFLTLEEQSQVPPSVFDNFEAWMVVVKKEEQRPMGLRDAISHASGAFQNAFASLGLSSRARGGPYVLELPHTLSDNQLINAENEFNSALAALIAFERMFGESNPRELNGLRAKLTYNKGVLKAAHLLERGDMARTMGTGYVANIILGEGHQGAHLPTVSQMYGSFINGAIGDFETAMRFFAGDELDNPDLRRAYNALAAWGWAMLDQATGLDPGEHRRLAGQWANGITQPAARQIIEAMQSSPRPLALVRLQ